MNYIVFREYCTVIIIGISLTRPKVSSCGRGQDSEDAQNLYIKDSKTSETWLPGLPILPRHPWLPGLLRLPRHPSLFLSFS